MCPPISHLNRHEIHTCAARDPRVREYIRRRREFSLRRAVDVPMIAATEASAGESAEEGRQDHADQDYCAYDPRIQQAVQGRQRDLPDKAPDTFEDRDRKYASDGQDGGHE